MNQDGKVDIAVVISANEEWEVVRAFYPSPTVEPSPFGEYFLIDIADNHCVFFQGGWGKVAAAASTQFTIDHFQPRLIFNPGTCGGFEGHINVGDVVLAEETMIYDIHERMGDPDEALNFYTTRIDLSFLRGPFPHSVRIGRLVSADEDIDPGMVNRLRQEFGALAADWESAAIAWTAHRNDTPLIILRAVSDLVSETGGELYNGENFGNRAAEVMRPLLRALPGWIRCALQNI